jgi:hypothetical protein
MAVRFITYATKDFVRTAKALAKSAIDVGFDDATVLTADDVSSTDFARDNADILSRPRGDGYWLWKPFLIDRYVETLKGGDALMYCDAGRSEYYCFRKFPEFLVKRVAGNGSGFLLAPTIPHLGAMRSWTKRDCFALMGADEPRYWDAPMILATWSLWTKTERSTSFIHRWLSACCDRRILTDDPNTCGLPNLPEFRDHRHDQSVLSVVAHQEGADFLDFTDTRVHRILSARPGSGLGHVFYKRPENSDRLLAKDDPLILGREFVRAKLAR